MPLINCKVELKDNTNANPSNIIYTTNDTK